MPARPSGSINSVTFDLNVCEQSVSDVCYRGPHGSDPSTISSGSTPRKFPLKSILRKNSKYGRTDRWPQTKWIKDSGGLSKIIKRDIWESRGFLWPDNVDTIPINQQIYMLRIWEVIENDLEEEENDVDLSTYEIVDPPPSVVDLTLYNPETDEDGVFAGADQPFVEDRLNSTSDFFETEWILGYSIDRSLSNDSFAVIESTSQPTTSEAGSNSMGEIQEDSDEIERYHLEKLLSIQDSISASKDHFDKGRLVVPVVFHRSQGYPCSSSLLVKKDLTSTDIEEAFGLSDNGSIIINLDHIVVHQGYFGFNRGKAKKKYKNVPKGKDPLNPTTMDKLRMWFEDRIAKRLNKKLEKLRNLFRGTSFIAYISFRSSSHYVADLGIWGEMG